ncbi:unnamed protein product [Mytilus coruscus]|uniref:Novel STAND NTPase 3 domain-containing protein n=1 Tax=Mytilus coruscus TaxID=42192 RepID=A0A6J8EM14_MYTCO|nr:unnamed protein product [Mytilus coruscus]
MERQQLMNLSDWNEEFLHDLINKMIIAEIQSITNVQYAQLFTMVQEMECPLYETFEDVLRYAMPVVTVPKKWARVTRSVMNNLTPQEKPTTINNESIGNVCDALGIRRSTLLHRPENLSSTLLTVKPFHEICLFKNRYSYTWSDVTEWTNNMLPEGMLVNKNKVLYLYKKINDNFQSYMKNGQTEDLDTFKSSKFFKFLNSTLQPKLQTDMQKNSRSLKRQCLKLVANQRVVLTENQELCFENEVLKEQIVEQNKNIRNNESESVKRNQEFRKLRLTKEANVNLKEENKSLKENLTSLKKETLCRFINMNQIIENKVELGIAKYKNAIHDQHIEKWRRDDEKFIVTEATRQVEKQLKEKNCVLVVGRSGNGKSSILRHHALRFEIETKYQIIPIVTNPSDILQFYNQKRKQIFVIDDLWGKERINAQSVDDWSTQISEILSLLKPEYAFKEEYEPADNVKLMFATGVDIYNDSVFDRLGLLRNYVCDISNWPLNDQEKLAMIRNYIPPESESKLAEKLESDEAYFPLLCRIAEGKTVEQIIMLFSNLNEFIRTDISVLKDTNNLKFCIITLCALLENNFKEEILNGVYESSIEREAFENICMEFNLGSQQESAKSKIKDQLKNLEGTYVTKSEAYFHFIHTKVYHIAVLVCGQTYLHSFINLLRSSFIAERFCFQSSMTDKNNDFIIIYDDSSEKKYFDRLMIDLEQGITYSTFHNSQLQYKSYREKFISFFRSRKQKVTKLLKHLKNDTHDNTLDNNDYEDYIDFRKQHHFSQHKMRKPIIESTWEGYADIVQMLLECDCNVNEVDKFGRTALFVACLLGKTEVVIVLLDHNADHSLCDKTGKSPLLVASREGYDEIVNALVHKNANVNQCDDKGDSPLIVASSEGNLWVVQIVSAQKPDFSTCNNLGQSPVFVASMNGHSDVLQYLLKHFNESINTIDNEGRSTLYIACKNGHHAVVQILLKNQADISQCDWKKQSPIFIASAEGHAEIVKTLIQSNADVNQCDEEGMTPLFIASDKGRIEVIEILVNSVTVDDLNITDFKKRTPLYAACRRGFTDIVKLLHKHNASIKMCNKWGGSPLFAACREGHFNIVKYLVENGGKIFYKDLNGTTPLLVAIENGFSEIAKFLIYKGADINQFDNYKKTPLHRAVVGDHLDIVKVLINEGALQTITDNDNQTPYDLACKYSCADIVKMLRPDR